MWPPPAWPSNGIANQSPARSSSSQFRDKWALLVDAQCDNGPGCAQGRATANTELRIVALPQSHITHRINRSWGETHASVNPLGLIKWRCLCSSGSGNWDINIDLAPICATSVDLEHRASSITTALICRRGSISPHSTSDGDTGPYVTGPERHRLEETTALRERKLEPRALSDSPVYDEGLRPVSRHPHPPSRTVTARGSLLAAMC